MVAKEDWGRKGRKLCLGLLGVVICLGLLVGSVTVRAGGGCCSIDFDDIPRNTGGKEKVRLHVVGIDMVKEITDYFKVQARLKQLPGIGMIIVKDKSTVEVVYNAKQVTVAEMVDILARSGYRGVLVTR